MRAFLCTALLAACAAPAATTPAPATPIAPPATPAAAAPALPTGTVLAADTPSADTDGNTFVAPAGWRLATAGAMTVLTPPEGDSHIAFVAVASASNDAARDAAWRAYKPGAPWPVLTANDAPDRDGWAKQKVYEYQTSPNEKRVVQVATQFANGRYLAIIVDFDQAVAEKRGGQLGKVFSHLYPKGFSRESFAGRTAATLDAGKIAALQKLVADAEAATGVPGVSFGVVQDGKTVWAGGVGVRELGKPERVDAKTLYMIASNTKALTTLMLAKLVDAKKFAWDTPVTQVLPSFQLGSAEVTKEVQMQHLICACTGMPRQDLEWILEWKDSTPASVLKSLASMVPTSKFGELFQYSNLMAAAGGYVGAHAQYPTLELGAAYDKAMQQLVFDPLGMTATTFDFAKAQRGNYARPHGLDVDGKPAHDLMAVNYSVISARPAGAAWSNVEDMLKYVEMELDDGALPNGQRYVSKDALYARRKPGVAIGADAAYGMGLMVQTKYDVAVIHHGGDMIGYHSDMMWIPSAHVGAVILTNGDLGPEIRSAFLRKLLELLYDGKPEADENVATSAKNTFASIAAARKLLAVPADATAAGALAAHYQNAQLGAITVTHAGGKTVFDFGEFASEVASLKNTDGTTSFITTAPGISGLDFVAGTANGAPTLTTRDGQHEYVFTAR